MGKLAWGFSRLSFSLLCLSFTINKTYKGKQLDRARGIFFSPFAMQNTEKQIAITRIQTACHAVFMARSAIFLSDGDFDKRHSLIARLQKVENELQAIMKKAEKL